MHPGGRGDAGDRLARSTVALSVLFATVAMVGGTLLALGSSIPISPYVTTISFACYVGCRLVGSRRERRTSMRRATEETAEPVPETAVPAHHP